MIIALDARPLVTRRVGGAEQRARNILQAWIRNPPPDHEFRLLYTQPDEVDAFDDSLIRSLPETFHAEEISSYQMPSRFPTGTRMLNALSRALNRSRADVYHAFTPLAPRTGLCPVVPTIHDLSFQLDPVVRRTHQSAEMRRLMSRTVKYSERLITISSQTKYDVASVYHVDPSHIDVIYNGFDPVFAPSLGLASLQMVHARNHITSPYVLAVGADIPRRNYRRMLAAMQRVWNTGLRVQWVLAGREKWEEAEIYLTAKGLALLEQIRFVDAPTNAELADLYRGATVTCCGSSFEGFGLSVLESMACGTSVACSDMRSLREVADEAAVYFPHDDAQAMGDALAGLLEDAEYRRQLKYRGLQRARLFTWETAAALTLKSLEAVAGPQQSPPPSPKPTLPQSA